VAKVALIWAEHIQSLNHYDLGKAGGGAAGGALDESD
jgi:hypothetical protein